MLPMSLYIHLLLETYSKFKIFYQFGFHLPVVKIHRNSIFSEVLATCRILENLCNLWFIELKYNVLQGFRILRCWGCLSYLSSSLYLLWKVRISRVCVHRRKYWLQALHKLCFFLLASIHSNSRKLRFPNVSTISAAWKSWEFLVYTRHWNLNCFKYYCYITILSSVCKIFQLFFQRFGILGIMLLVH